VRLIPALVLVGGLMIGLATLAGAWLARRQAARRELLFMDVHQIDGGVAMDDVAQAHLAGRQAQGGARRAVLRYSSPRSATAESPLGR
jgi:hypothetical protein